MVSSRTESIQATLARRLDRHPDGRALAYYDATRAFEWRAFGTALEQASGSQAALIEAGLKPGDVTVVIMSEPDATSCMLLAILLAGGVPLLVAPPVIQGVNSSLPEIVRGVAAKTNAPVVVYSNRAQAAELHPQQTTAARAVISDEITHDSSGPLRFAERSAQSIAAMQLTSGTTGFPRICVWTHEKVQAALSGMARAMDVGADDTFLNWTPLYHDMGLMNNFMLCLVYEIPLVLMSPFDVIKRPAIWPQALSDTAATTSWSPNFGFALAAQRAFEDHLEGIRLDHVRGLWNAAERIHYDTLVEFQRRYEPYGLPATAIKTNFGCAENVGGATFSDPIGMYKVEMIDPVALHERQVAVPAKDAQQAMAVVGVGKGHPGITLHILDSDGRDLPDGHVGQVAMDTPSRMEGYLGDPDETARVFSGNLLMTGDHGYLRDGEFFWTGRTRECIAYRGRKIDPSDFESPLLKVADLRPGCFVAFGLDDAKRGTEKIAIVSEVKNDSCRSLEAVRKEVSESVARHLGLTIDRLVMVRRGTLTKTSSGKRRHRHFRDLYLRGDLDQYQVGVEKWRSKKTDEFDPTSDLFVAQFEKPASVQEVNLRALTPFQRALLVIDGTVTKFLEAVTMEPIEIVRVGQARKRLAEDNPWLEVAADSEVVARQVILRGKYSHTLHAYALSLIVTSRLSDQVQRGLDLEHGGLGRLLLASEVETRREVLWYGRERLDELPPELDGLSDGEFIVRAYRIIAKGKPVMLIKERFPVNSEAWSSET